jgi:HPr kinase/phosphorylase
MPTAPKTTTLHGVFIDVLGLGVLLNGRSGIGKSELALGLLDRGHNLVADDSVIFAKRQDKLFGSCPEVLQDFLEVRGLGILNIRAMFGDDAITNEKCLQLIINIIQVNQNDLYLIDRLHGMHGEKKVIGINIPEVSIPVAPGRSLAILVESAVKNHLLKLDGYNASQDFTKKHNAFMLRENNAR